MKVQAWRKTMFATTTVPIRTTQGEIMGMLHTWGARQIGFDHYQGGGGAVIFNLAGRGYKIVAVPVSVEVPMRWRGNAHAVDEARERQAWRWIAHYLKGLVGMELFRSVDELLLPFMLVPGRDGQIRTLAEWANDDRGIPQIEASIGP